MRPRTVGVAYSGGRDSLALLHATLAAAEPLGIRVVALHVHHGLSREADRWLVYGQALCTRWARRGRPVEFAAHVVAGRPGRGESVEAWARQARYRALRALAQARGIDLVLLGHHRRDQAETFVLQALRGGGVAALSAMPRQIEREGITWARPWLDEPREAIDGYVRRHRLGPVEDDTNGDLRFARNRLRTRVWPALTSAFADAEASLAGAAERAQEAAAALAELAAIDLAAIASGDALDLSAWRALSAPRRVNVLRAWLRECSGRAAPASLVARMKTELMQAGALRWPGESGEWRSYRGRLSFEASAPPAAKAAAAKPSGPVDLSVPGVHAIDRWHGAFVVTPVASGGMALAVAARLVLRERAPGDRFQAGLARPPRSLKLQYQAAGVPAWWRTGPVACHGGRTVFVAGLGVDARALAAPGEAQVSLEWRPR
ncbi:MAG: tRNA lysidine(34) synthetase TilS [Caldimonas sp.]